MTKTLAIIHPSYDIPFIFEVAARDGYKLVSILPEHGLETCQYEAVIGSAILPIYEDPETALLEFEALHTKWQFDGIWPIKEHSMVWASTLAKRLGMPGISPEASVAARDKTTMRSRFERAGMRVPRNVTVLPDDSSSVCANLTFPVVVKPASGYNSSGVQLAYCEAELDPAICHVRELNRQIYDEHSWSTMGTFSKVIVEEFIDGPEYVVETFAVDGDVRALNCGYKGDPKGPYFEETIYLCPSGAGTELEAKMKAEAINGTKALGLNNGPAHCEMRLDANNEPVLLEIGARLGGAGCAHFNVEASSGVDLAGLQMHQVAGTLTSAHWPPPEQGLGKAASSWIMPLGGSGYLESVTGLDDVKRHPDFRHALEFARFGEFYRPYPDFDGYIYIIFGQHDGPEQGYAFFDFLDATLKAQWRSVDVGSVA
ncbi:phosphoribosylglycinamide synthetase [Tateyamaria omphalii]|uniref:ATP-grasp domain-containing protein n=1 Tax=Tateyamaria omphalii TaxID=299262 RepID=UPI001671EEF4|nr:ATP-grasp domain-containing protein [Tateyamaria omphalii]GGX38077.1 phosphoribosylglycinamide synthetase [Tateyamaria omphalii]